MFSTNVMALVNVAQSKGIKFVWETNAPKGTLGWYSNNKGVRTVHIRKGMNQQMTEETIVHEIAHALWDLSLKGNKRKDLKKMKINLGFFKSLGINFLYSKEDREEERFAFYMETKPTLVLHLLNQI